jgi:hypothetical protein
MRLFEKRRAGARFGKRDLEKARADVEVLHDQQQRCQKSGTAKQRDLLERFDLSWSERERRIR